MRRGEDTVAITRKKPTFAKPEFIGRAEIVASGTLEGGLKWVLDEDGLLTIEGTGNMLGFHWYENVANPWQDEKEKIRKVYIAEGITNIREWAFQNCSNLHSITVSNSVTEIGEYAFSNCVSLRSITIPNGVTKIGTGAFEGCCSLRSITIPNGVTKIGAWAFCGCCSLKSIAIPDSVRKLGDSIFLGCDNLQHVQMPIRFNKFFLWGYNIRYACSEDVVEFV